MAATDPTWNFQDPASKDRVLGVLRNEMDTTFALVADPARWQARELGALSQDVLLKRLRDDADRMMGEFTALSADDWTGLMPPHKVASSFRSLFFPI